MSCPASVCIRPVCSMPQVSHLPVVNLISSGCCRLYPLVNDELYLLVNHHSRHSRLHSLFAQSCPVSGQPLHSSFRPPSTKVGHSVAFVAEQVLRSGVAADWGRRPLAILLISVLLVRYWGMRTLRDGSTVKYNCFRQQWLSVRPHLPAWPHMRGRSVSVTRVSVLLKLFLRCLSPFHRLRIDEDGKLHVRDVRQELLQGPGPAVRARLRSAVADWHCSG